MKEKLKTIGNVLIVISVCFIFTFALYLLYNYIVQQAWWKNIMDFYGEVRPMLFMSFAGWVLSFGLLVNDKLPKWTLWPGIIIWLSIFVFLIFVFIALPPDPNASEFVMDYY